MTSAFPGSLDSLATNKADATATATDHPAHHNDLADAVNKIEAELGIDPSAGFATVRERFEAIDLKQSCKAATTAALPAATYATGPPATLTANANGALAAQDGVTLAAADRLFVKDQAAPLQNGIYSVTNAGSAGAAWVLTRTGDADTALKVADTLMVTVEQGTAQSDTVWELVSDNPITLGTTALRFARILPPYVAAGGRDWKPDAAKLENTTRVNATSNVTALTGGTLKAVGGIVVPAGMAITSVTFSSASTAGATLTHMWAGIVRVSDRNLLAVSADDTATSWAANAERSWNLSSVWTPDSDTRVWVVLNVTGTTMPTLQGTAINVNGNNTATGLAPLLFGNSNTGLTTPLTVGTIITAPSISGTGFPYCRLN